MSRIAEKNDVDISQLFKWNKEVDISDTYTGSTIKLYLRLVGDAELARSRAYAYRKSAELRKSLKKDGSDERISFIAELSEVKNKEAMVQSIVLLRLADMNMRAMRDTNLLEPKEPSSDATQEDWENYQVAIDQYPKDFTNLVLKKVEELRSKEEEDTKKLPLKLLYDTYEAEVIEKMCVEEMQTRYYDMCTYLGTYKDNKFRTRAFLSVDDFDNLHPQLKNRLKTEYQSLELGTDILKKLPEATE
jgi:hypothetical protein